MNAHDAATAGKNGPPVADKPAMSTAGRVMLSSLAAIVAPGLLLMLIMLPSMVSNDLLGGLLSGAGFIFGVATLVAAIHVAVLGIPYVLVLWKIGRVRWLPMVAGGFAMGFLPGFCFTVLPYLLEHAATGFNGGAGTFLHTNMRFLVFTGGFGALSALVFHIAFRWLSRGRVEAAVRPHST